MINILQVDGEDKIIRAVFGHGTLGIAIGTLENTPIISLGIRENDGRMGNLPLSEVESHEPIMLLQFDNIEGVEALEQALNDLKKNFFQKEE